MDMINQDKLSANFENITNAVITNRIKENALKKRLLLWHYRMPDATVFTWSERQDLNLRPPDPQSGALPNCATPRWRADVLYIVSAKYGRKK